MNSRRGGRIVGECLVRAQRAGPAGVEENGLLMVCRRVRPVVGRGRVAGDPYVRPAG